MAKVDIIQTSFASGEFGPSLYGRTDIAQYANACAIVQNFLPRSYGPAISMPGLTYVGTVSNSTLRTRLIKFVFNRSDAYVIEMGKYYFRFYTSGAIVVTTGTTPFVLTHIYDETEIADVHFTQLNDVIYLFHKSHPIQKLVRKSAASWTITDAPIIGGPFLDNNTPILTSANVSAGTLTITASATTGTVNITVSPTNASLFTPSSGSTVGHVGSYWMIGGLSQTNATTGLQEMGYVRITYITNSYTATATVIKNLKVAVATTVWAEGAWSAVRGYPARGTFQERRLWAGRTTFQPQNEWGSRAFSYEDFTLDTQADDDGINIGLASTESNELQWLAPGKSLFGGTFGGVFVTNSKSTDPITPNNVSAGEEVGFGSQPIMPKKVGNYLYFVQRFGKKLREMYYNFQTDTYKAVDRTILAPHILGDGVVDMDVAQNPESILYCVRTDGTLATMTREVDQEVTAWARHTTAGTYCSVAIIPSQTGLYDDVWVIVQRYVNGSEVRYIELFDSIELPVRQDLMNYLHASLRYNAFLTGSSSTLTISLSRTGGTGTISTVTASGAVFVAGNVGKRIRAIDANGNNLGEGKITSYTSSTVVNISITNTFSTTSYAVNRWGISVSTISGLSHLEGKSVRVLADGGMDSPDKTVTTAAITLAYDYFVVNVGLQYDQIIQTLKKEAGSMRGTSQGKKQRINTLAFKLNRSFKGFKAGRDADNLDVVATRDPATPLGTAEPLFTGTLPNDFSGTPFSFPGDWEYGSQVYIKNDKPLPMELLAIVINLETMDQ